MASKQYVISETGEFPAQYKVLKLGENGIYTPVFGPDPDLSDAERKCAEMNGERARNDEGHYIADDPSTPDVNEAYVGGKAPTKPKKTAAKKKTPAKKAVAKKPAAKKATKKK
jgi:hypothetical protein|tara:strand:+ start:1031 stop:1369 length:339 start_codon:yes stop_codon:yes gene_type:complete